MLKLRYLYISIWLPITLILGINFVFSSKIVLAQDVETVSTYNGAEIAYSVTSKKIDRVEAIRKFFKKYNSALANNAETFVRVADQYGIDYKIMPAISCMESTCAKFLIPGTYNPFGWGAGRIKFGSYDEGIERVGKGLSEIYLSRGLDTAEKIAPVYNPPSPGSWTRGVNFFIGKIEEFSMRG